MELEVAIKGLGTRSWISKMLLFLLLLNAAVNSVPLVRVPTRTWGGGVEVEVEVGDEIGVSEPDCFRFLLPFFEEGGVVGRGSWVWAWACAWGVKRCREAAGAESSLRDLIADSSDGPTEEEENVAIVLLLSNTTQILPAEAFAPSELVHPISPFWPVSELYLADVDLELGSEIEIEWLEVNVSLHSLAADEKSTVVEELGKTVKLGNSIFWV